MSSEKVIKEKSEKNPKHNEEKNVLTYLEKKVEEVYNFRDRYFENHNLDDAIHKNDDVDKLQKEILKILNKNETAALNINKAKFYYLKGRLLNVISTYDKDAENLLSKSIKLDKKLVEAWNELGECYWKNNEQKKAINCFEGALKERKNKISLRSLSMLYRQESGKSSAETLGFLEKGLTYAKEAVQLDPQDGISWCILGNAHLSYFFGIQQNPKTLRQCLSAYSQAEKDIVARSTPDLYYNKGITLKYKEEFKEALECFDQSIIYDPTWLPPKEMQQELIKYLNEIMELLTSKGKLKTKKLTTLLNSLNIKDLGPYLDDTKNLITGEYAKLIKTKIKDLKPGLNEIKIILGKVICSVRNEHTVPFTFCLMDEDGECIVVTIFNIADGRGVIIGDSVAIPEPFLTEYNFEYRSTKYNFKSIRVERPILLAVNGKLLQKNQAAGVQMSLFNKSE